VRANEAPAVVELKIEPAALVEIDARACPDALVEIVDDGGRRYGCAIDRTRFNRAVERSWHSDVPKLWLPAANYTLEARGQERRFRRRREPARRVAALNRPASVHFIVARRSTSMRSNASMRTKPRRGNSMSVIR
jgi:hypothetical protein